MDIFILELVSNQLTVPVKIDGRQQQEETSALLITGDQDSARFQVPNLRGNMRSCMVWCYMEMFILYSTVPVKIDGRLLREEVASTIECADMRAKYEATTASVYLFSTKFHFHVL